MAFFLSRWVRGDMVDSAAPGAWLTLALFTGLSFCEPVKQSETTTDLNVARGTNHRQMNRPPSPGWRVLGLTDSGCRRGLLESPLAGPTKCPRCGCQAIEVVVLWHSAHGPAGGCHTCTSSGWQPRRGQSLPKQAMGGRGEFRG